MAEPARDAAVPDDWNWAERAAAWRRWHPTLTEWWRGLTDLIVEWADIRPGMAVLDLASGTGEPALTIAPLVGPEGSVTATDVIPEMVAIAADHAAAGGQGQHALPGGGRRGAPLPGCVFRPRHLPSRRDVLPRCAAGAPRGAARAQTRWSRRLRHLGAAGAD